MGRIHFTTLRKLKGGEPVPVVRLSRETTGKAGKVFDIDIYPDGTEGYGVNSGPADGLPDLPSVRELKAVKVKVKDKAVALLGHPFDGPDYRAAWWELKGVVEAL